MNALWYVLLLYNIYWLFAELENQLRSLDQLSDLKMSPIQHMDSLQRVRELEKCLRLLKQEKEEAQKVITTSSFTHYSNIRDSNNYFT